MLLFITLAVAAFTYDAFRWEAPLRGMPLTRELASGHVPLAAQEEASDASPSHPLLRFGGLPWLFLGMTLLLALMTVEAFID